MLSITLCICSVNSISVVLLLIWYEMYTLSYSNRVPKAKADLASYIYGSNYKKKPEREWTIQFLNTCAPLRICLYFHPRFTWLSFKNHALVLFKFHFHLYVTEKKENKKKGRNKTKTQNKQK